MSAPNRKKAKRESAKIDDLDYDEEKKSQPRRKATTTSVGKRGKAKVVDSAIESVEYSSSFAGEGELPSDNVECRDYTAVLSLKPDHVSRPLWVTKENLIYLEAFSPIYHQAYDFLVAIAEPESRPEYIHTYRLTENSLYAAVAVSIDTESIILVLNRLCKTNLPKEVEDFIRTSTYTFGKAKIVLKENNFFIESKYPDVLKELLRNPVIKTHTVNLQGEAFLTSDAPTEDARNLDYIKLGKEEMDNEDDFEDDTGLGYPGSGLGVHKPHSVSFMIERSFVQVVKKSAKEASKYPLMEEYDFKNDLSNPVLSIDLRPSTRIRPYQEKSLSKMFGNGRARSGIIVLPCGAGKSLTGVTAASTIKKSCIVMCINNASVKQWKEQFVMWTNCSEKKVHMFTSSSKENLTPKGDACIVITTYSMICHGGRRSASGEQIIQSIAGREWGLMILDEVHVAPADMFQKVVTNVNAHCKLGLTATLVREDNKIKDLSFLVGPKLYEANWIDLTLDGYLAKVECVEVWCPMTKEFYSEYIRRSFTSHSSRLCRLLYTLNPRKFRVCEYLLKYHADRGDKIIIFSDDVPALILYCEALSKIREIPYLFGGTKEDDRRKYLTAFKTSSQCCCIGLSKVGDTALDIPDANVIIQVSSHFGARRQEAQRLGRILRPKPNPTGAFNAFFYTLVSTDTREMYFSTKRQQYLVDQGYTFKVVQDLADKADAASTLLKSVSQEIDLLNKVISFNCNEYDATEAKELSRRGRGEVDDDDDVLNTGGVKRKVTSLSAVSGAAGGMIYKEFDYQG